MENAIQALLEYGYVKEGESYVWYMGVYPKHEKWTPVDDGFLRHDRYDGYWKPIPLNSETFIWPAQSVKDIYTYGKLG